MPISTLEAVDLLRFADLISERLAAAQAELGKKRGLEREKRWLAEAAAMLDEARAPAAGMVERARGLAELADLREEFAGTLQGGWVDALEKLLAGITFHVSGRSPVIEALFPHQKLATLRRAPRELAGKFQRDFEKRARSSYVSRMLGSPEFAFAEPVLEQLRKAWTEFEACFSAEGMPEEEAAPIRQALVDAGSKVDKVIRQAKLLAEAALVPLEGAFEASGIGQKMKKRAARPVEARPVDPELTADEVAATEAELAAEATEADLPAPAPEAAAAAPEVPAEQPAPKPARKKRGKAAAVEEQQPAPEQPEPQA